MSDIHAETATRQYMPQTFWKMMTPQVKAQAATAKIPNNMPALRKRKIKVQMKRLQQKITIAMMLYCCDNTSAERSSMPCSMKMRVPYWMTNVQHMIWAPT